MFFLDGLHLFEVLLRDFMNAERVSHHNSMIVMHDCIPVDMRMTRRDRFSSSPYPSIYPEEWWAGDVWRILPILKKYRPDLRIHCLDAKPTGIVVVTGLNPKSTTLADCYYDIVTEGLALDLSKIGMQKFFDHLPVRSTEDYGNYSNLSKHFWL